jgi:hypothetical protein
MNAQEQAVLGAKIERALQQAGLAIERAKFVGGNLRGWEPIPGPALVARWLMLGWRVVEVPRMGEL